MALLYSSYSNAQTDPSTGNLINYGTSPTDTTSTWNNGVYVNQLCFGAGQPGNCGPNPSIREGNYINYSYGTVDLNQIVNINKALSIGGSGVQLSGFNFGFTAKNGNGWDDGRQDYLSAYVKLYGSTGSQVASYDYTAQTNQRYNWRQFNFSETFATPYVASTLGNAQVGFVGRDNNFWAGTYGPEIYNVSFSLKYSVRPDPCIADPLSSPTCPGYALATVKNSILGSTVSNASVTSFVPAPNYALVSQGPAMIGSDPTNPSPGSQGPIGAQGPQGSQGPAAGPIGQDLNQNFGGPQDSPSQQGPQQGPSPGPQPAGGPPQTTTASTPPPSSGGPSGGQPSNAGTGPSKLAMSVVRSVQAKEQAIQQTAVQSAAKTLESSLQSSQASSNAAITMNQDMSASSATNAASFASQQTQASQQTITQTSQQQQTVQSTNTQPQQASRVVQQAQQVQQDMQQQQVQSSTSVVKLQMPQQQDTAQASIQTSNGATQTPPSTYTPPMQTQQDAPATQVTMLKPPTTSVNEVQPQSSTGTGLTINRNTFSYNPFPAYSASNTMQPQLQTAPVYQPRIQERSTEVDTPQMPIASFSGSRAGNPLSEIMMQQRFDMMQNNTAQPTSSVNRNVQPNDLATGVDLTAMAVLPQGFNAYSLVLKDATFYEPKEVYKNQRTVDNERVLRGLTRGSDSLHQQMVDQQYKGN